MDNLFFGLQSIAINMRQTILALIQNQIIWGFIIGFGGSTVVHLLVSTEQPKHIPHILTKEVSSAFNKVAKRNSSGMFLTSYTKFEQDYHRTRALAYTVILAFLAIMIIALLRY
jgi:hypothetical protein